MFIRSTVVALTLVTGLSAVTSPADAQRRRNVVEVFGNEPCPDPKGDEIVVCKRLGENDRWRIPLRFREPTSEDATTQESRVNEMDAIGRTGIGSCSAVGPGGSIGCGLQQIRQGSAEKRDIARARKEEPR